MMKRKYEFAERHETRNYAPSLSLLQAMVDKDLKRNPVFTAIDELEDPDDIRRFVQEYEEWMKINAGKDVPDDYSDYSIPLPGSRRPDTIGHEVDIARGNIGYILGYYSGETQELWYGILDNVSHPVFGYGFGRGTNPTPKEAFEMGKALGKKARREKDPERGRHNLVERLLDER